MASKSELKQQRNEAIRSRMAKGETAKSLANEFGLHTGTIRAITKQYKGSGYAAKQDCRVDEYAGVDVVKAEKAALGGVLELHSTCLLDVLDKAREKRIIWLGLLDTVYQIYRDSGAGTCAAELAIHELIGIAAKLQSVEGKISAASNALGAINLAMKCAGGDRHAKTKADSYS